MRFPTLSNKRVLAFAPDVLPLHLDDEKDFRAAVMGFVQVHHPPQTTIALWSRLHPICLACSRYPSVYVISPLTLSL